MTDYANKLSTISEKKQKLLAEESKLIEKRKREIGVLAEKFGLLTLSNITINGVFHELKSACKNNPEKIKSWDTQGAQVLKPKRNTQSTQKSTS